MTGLPLPPVPEPTAVRDAMLRRPTTWWNPSGPAGCSPSATPG